MISGVYVQTVITFHKIPSAFILEMKRIVPICRELKNNTGMRNFEPSLHRRLVLAIKTLENVLGKMIALARNLSRNSTKTFLTKTWLTTLID